jgi:hypothetical protein
LRLIEIPRALMEKYQAEQRKELEATVTPKSDKKKEKD